MNGKRTIDVVTFYPGQRISVTKRAQELGVAVDYDAQSSVMVIGAPSSLRHGQRVVPWVSETPFVGMFGGDGESIDFEGGPVNDWRQPTQRTGQAFADAAELQLAADALYKELDDKAGTRALIRAQDAHRATPGVGAKLMTLTFTVVLFTLALTFFSYAETRGGLGGIVNPGGEAEVFVP